MAEFTITLNIDVDDLDARLRTARALVTVLEEAQRLAAELVGPSTPKAAADRPPPRAVAETNGHGPKKSGRPSGSTPTARRERRVFTDEQKQKTAGAVSGWVARRARVEWLVEVGVLAVPDEPCDCTAVPRPFDLLDGLEPHYHARATCRAKVPARPGAQA